MRETWIVGVSGGPDSMALLHYLKHQGFHVVAAHVNYQKRDTSNRDEDVVSNYCMKHSIGFEVRYFEDTKKGNFQAVARDFRYSFFKDLVSKYSAKGVAIAHHKNDDVETYWMQLESNRGGYPGIAVNSIVNGVEVWRPFSSKSKEDLIEYCNKNDIPYEIDESNLTLDYTRNRIRHELNKLSKKEYEIEYSKLLKSREDYLRHQQILETLGNPFLISDYLEIAVTNRLSVLRKWFNSKGIGYSFSDKYLEELDKNIENGKSQIPLENKLLSISMGEVMLHDEDISFSYGLDSIEYFETKYFKLTDIGETIEGVTLTEEDFPITIRTPKEDDVIQMRFGKKKLNRFFIDRKIPIHRRKTWVVIENCVKDVVFVVLLGCDIHHFSNNPNLFVIKL